MPDIGDSATSSLSFGSQFWFQVMVQLLAYEVAYILDNISPSQSYSWRLKKKFDLSFVVNSGPRERYYITWAFYA